MATNVAEESIWAAGVAARLRLLQVNCADAPPAQRREFLCEAVADALKGVSSTRRDGCLSALAERFPAWSAPTAPPPPPPPPPPVQQTPEEMVDALIALVPELPVETRMAFAKKLADAKLVTAPLASPNEITKEVQAAFGLAQQPRLDRVVPLLSMLADLLEKLDQVACKTLQNLPDRPDFKDVNAGDLREAIRTFLVANGQGSLETLALSSQKIVEKHRRAMVALMASHVGMKGVPSAGRDFARWFLESFSPQNIEDVARAEGGGIWPGGLPERCWKKYSQRFREDLSTPEHIDKKVRDAVANTAERLFQLKT